MRRILVAAIALVVALACTAAAQPAVKFVIKGRGWGHGIGLAQYGAQGYASKDGRGYRWILRHYYSGTGIATRSASIKVLLASRRSSLPLGSSSSFRSGSATFSAGTWTVSTAANGRLKLVKGDVTRRVSSPAKFRPGASALVLGGTAYRGTITLRRSGSRVWALNTVALDGYVKGVVPREMPSSWHQQALRAQAVAARSYALAAGGHCSWFGTGVMCPDTSDQVYSGKSGEATTTNAAVDATPGEVIVSGGSVAIAFFSSTSGGKTAAKHHEWGGAPVSYLQSVPDPHDTLSPHHRWGPRDAEADCLGTAQDCVWSGPAMKARLGGSAPSGLRDLVVSARNGSSRVATVRATGTGGARTITGASMRSLLGLRSTWFSIGVLRITGGGTVESGQRKRLRLLARNVSGAKFQRRRSGQSEWVTVRSVQGSESATVRPRVTTFYRLASPSATTAAVKVTVRSQASPKLALLEG
jgi:SpoIID/LytB domain protein